MGKKAMLDHAKMVVRQDSHIEQLADKVEACKQFITEDNVMNNQHIPTTEAEISMLIERERALADSKGHWEMDERDQAVIRNLARQVLTLGWHVGEPVGFKPNTAKLDTDLLMQVMDALIDTAKRTTELEHVYNDAEGTSFSWEEVEAVQQELMDANALPRVG